MKTVYVGLSGGVDSSVSAAILKEQGYNVIGVYMKNWSQDLPGFHCPWKEDYQDAKRVAVQLGIEFKMFDFEKEYKQKVVDYMIEEYKLGNTPNPDIMCNQEIKFKLFLETSLADGADLIATGHYARMSEQASSTNHQATNLSQINVEKPSQSIVHSNVNESTPRLLQAIDKNKDQTYFLYRITEEALGKTLFPIGHLTKPEVRELAKKYGLATASKKESMGICFVGKVGIKEFLNQYITTEPGDILDSNGYKVGMHDGAIFYTIGQRQGLGVGGGLPYYVIGKNMAKNEVYVTTDLADKHLWSKEITLTNVHLINPENLLTDLTGVTMRFRHRAPLVTVESLSYDGFTLRLVLKDEVRALTPGQSTVLYCGDVCLGGGVVI